MSHIHFKSSGYYPSPINEFTSKPFDDGWVFLKLVDTSEFKIFNGGNENVFSVTISKQCDDWQFRVMDFIEYETSCNKNIIVAVEGQDMESAKACYGNHHYTDKFLRAYESKVLVHSTTLENYKSILEDGFLKSWNCLKNQGKMNETVPLGRSLGDPYDYSDYVMFTHGGVAGEIVVNSRQKGKIVMDTNTEYKAGARFYFDARKIAEAGLLVRDGAHLKVKDQLSLEKYLIWCATIDNVNMEGLLATPNNFSLQADKTFEQKSNLQTA